MANLKIALIGSTGRLGSTLMELYGDDIIPTDFRVQHLCDIEDWVNKHRNEFSVVINTAAKTDVCECEEFPNEAFKTNVLGAFNVARAFNARGKSVIYISTDHVFGGKNKWAWSEEDCPEPIGVYAMSKYLGEEATITTGRKNLIIRTSFIKDFPLERAFEDKYFSGDTIDIIAKEIWEAAKCFKYVLYYLDGTILHIGTGKHSIYDIAKKLNPEVLPMKLSENPINKVGLDYLRDTTLNSSRWTYLKERLDIE
ncbi:MAG: sugar nucleotide-binding protein [Phycisphaerae bacterium]|jgi:dTDP-4-dehydrorhamnose reductase